MVAYKQLGNISDLGDLAIKIDSIPSNMDEKIQNDTSVIIKNVLKTHGYSGTWRLNAVKRRRNINHDVAKFEAKTLCPAKSGGQTGIKIFTKSDSKERKTCYESILVPPDNIEAADVLQSFENGHPESNGESATAQRAKEGEIYTGIVVDLKKTVAVIKIFPDNPAGTQDVTVITDYICHGFLDKPKQGLTQNQFVRIKCIGLDSNGKAIMSRVVLLAENDQFSGKKVNGVLQLLNFSGCDERVAMILDVMTRSIEKYRNQATWDRASLQGIVGHVFMDGKGYAYAPAEFVREDMKKAITKQWNAKDVTTTSGLIRYLLNREYIFATYEPGASEKDVSTAIGYAMEPAGKAYDFLGRKMPPLPKYYEPPDDLFASKSKSESELAKTTNIEDAIDDLEVLEQYESKKIRLEKLDQELLELEVLHRERDEINGWMDAHPEAPELARQANKLEQMILARRARLESENK